MADPATVTDDPSAKRAKRMLWAMVLGIVLLNVVLFLLTLKRR